MSYLRRLARPVYKGPLKAAILDWSGTTADAFVIAPAVVFVDVFEKHGVPITMPEAREPMGLRKDLHIAKILENPEVQRRWKEKKGRSSTADDVAEMFEDFVPMQVACLPKYTGLLPGVAETVQSLKDDFGLKIGTTTGFTEVMVDVLLKDAAAQGYHPDVSVAGDQVPFNMGFRPTPFMVFHNLVQMGIWPVESAVKVDDTVTGVQEGVNAGCWAVGVAGWSNYMDVDTMEQWADMSEVEKESRRHMSREKLVTSGAHYVIDDLTQLPEVVDEINQRMSMGETPMDSTSTMVRLT